MTIPAAPAEAGGNALLFLLVDDAGTNVPGLLRGLAATDYDGDTVASLAVATHEDESAFGPGDGVVVLAGVEEGGTAVHHLLTDDDGRLVVRAPGAYDSGGTTAYGHPVLVAHSTLNGGEVGWIGSATHAIGDPVGATDGVAVMGLARDDGDAVAGLGDDDGRTRTWSDFVPGGTGFIEPSAPGTATQFPSHACRRVIVTNPNANPVYLGFASDMTADDTPATAGLAVATGHPVVLDITNTNLLWVNAATAIGATFAWFV